MLRLGPERFTLSDVAEAVGLSRAALIQRFTDKRTLHLKTMQRSTQEVRDYFAAAPPDRGLVPLWAMLRDLISGMGTGEGFAGYLLLARDDISDPALNRLARERNQLVRAAIFERLPATADRADSAALIQMVISGACMLWLVEPQGTLAGYTEGETKKLLQRLYPGEQLD